MSKGLQIIKKNKNLAEWSRQVEECRNSGLSVRSWCEQHQIAVSTFHYRQQKVWKALQKSSMVNAVKVFTLRLCISAYYIHFKRVKVKIFTAFTISSSKSRCLSMKVIITTSRQR